MKKFLFVFGAVSVASVVAFAKTIDFDTVIKWNSDVIDQALNKAGLLGSQNAAWDVRVTHDRILAELLKRETFSVRDATAVCLDKCNMSDFLKNGRGQSGKKCPELCTDFADALVDVNNEYQKTGKLVTRVYSPDKLFYVEDVGNQPATKYSKVCTRPDASIEIVCENEYVITDIDAVVYESDTNTPVALLFDDGCPMLGSHMVWCVSDKYAWYHPESYCNGTDSCGFYYDSNIIDTRFAPMFTVADSIVKYKQGGLKQAEKGQDLRYEKLVEKNGYCESVYDYAGDNVMQSNMDKLCKRFARQYAQSHACKLHSYVRDGILWQDDVYGNQYIGNLFCGLNVSRNYIDNYHIKHETVNGYSPETEQYEYTPSYQDCVATFNEQKCDSISNGTYID